ncbi:hypothetical protein SAMN04489764_0305 [Thermostaphylospora chromogena]|uniref:Uncharacterized protein n=1 Tax=Thermostaphylospora chromogena TaxID=35622 RepID=A0A1H1A4U2_9ACTN|nr:hypothetical protein SAMN04489764_0305 [Thermostaphylospora chromogena]
MPGSNDAPARRVHVSPGVVLPGHGGVRALTRSPVSGARGDRVAPFPPPRLPAGAVADRPEAARRRLAREAAPDTEEPT